MRKIKACRLCGGKDLAAFLDLGLHPLANSLLKSKTEKERKFSLSLSFCRDCRLVQLNETINPKILFSHYVWVTGTSAQAKNFADNFALMLIKKGPKNERHFVLELASNDGTFLKPFQKKGFEVLGIDPAKNIVDIANKDGVPTKAMFWGEESAKKILEEYGHAPMVFARNVLAHVADQGDFVRGIKQILSPKGVVAIEPHYARHILDGLQYDSIYHEHLSYFTIHSLKQLLERNGLYVFDLEDSPISGGAFILYASKEKRPASKRLQAGLLYERKNKINELNTWKGFAQRVKKHKGEFLKILKKSKEKAGHLVGYGASARSSTLLNYCGINTNLIAEIADGNPLKQGLYTAGTRIPIKAPKDIFSRPQKAVSILGWNFTQEIMDILKKDFHFQGQCILPLPICPKIVNIK